MKTLPSRLFSPNLLMVLPLLALSACNKPAETEKAASEPTAPSSEWVEPNPTEPAVPVALPSTAMTNAPEPAPAAK